MNEYLASLREELYLVNADNIFEILDYFEEMISDRLENGEDLDVILNELGDPKQLASNFSSEEKKIVKNSDAIHLEYDNLKDLEIDIQNYNLKILRNDNDKVLVEYEENANYKLDIDYNRGSLYIEQKGIGFDLNRIRHRLSCSMIEKLNLSIYVPNTYNEKIEIDNVEGDIDICHLTLKKLEIDNVSGDINIKDITCKEFELDNVNGDVKLDDCSIRLLYIDVVNGDTNIDNIDFKTIDIESVNGDVDIRMLAKQEDVSLDLEKLFDHKKYKGNTDKTLKFETVNGDIRYEFMI